MADSHIPYELSADYELLCKLIQEGKEIAGWVYNQTYNRNEIVAIRYTKFGAIIGVRGYGYGFDTTSFNEFKQTCEIIQLQFIAP